MKFSNKSAKLRVKAEVSMTPVIDVVFQLLIFFMCTSTFVVQSTLPVQLPETNGGDVKMESKNLTITLAYGEGGPDNLGVVTMTMDDSVGISSWDELTRALQSHYAERPDDMILVQADKRVTTQRLVTVLSTLHNVGFKKYGLAAESPETEGR